MEKEQLKNIVETLLFISTEPLSLDKISELVDTEKNQVKEIIDELCKEYSTRGFQIQEIAEGYLFTTRAEYAPWIKKLYKDRITLKLSSAALETLSIIAYKQPISRAEIEEIRGVEVIAVLETLIEKKLVRVCGRKETLGRPLLYGTTNEFLKYFGLKSLSDIPALEEFKEIALEIEEPVVEENQLESQKQ